MEGGAGAGVGAGGGGRGAPFPQLSWIAVLLTTPSQILGFAGLSTAVLGATLQLLFPRQSLPTTALVVAWTPWQLALSVNLPQVPPGDPIDAKSTETKCSPAGQEKSILQSILSTDFAQTVEALSLVCAGHVPAGEGGAGAGPGPGGAGEGGPGAGEGASALPNMISWYTSDRIHRGGATPKYLCTTFSAISREPSPQSAGWKASFAM